MMKTSFRSILIVAAALAATLSIAQTQPANDKITLSGTYTIERLNADSTSVSMTFTANVMNTGGKSLKGKIALNNPAMIQKVYKQFGDQTIAAGGTIKLSDTVTIPREEYDQWMSRGPSLTYYAQNDRGELKTYRIPLSGKAPAPGQ